MRAPAEGFTLIEILVAIAMLSIIVVAVSGVLIGILRITGGTQAQQSFGYVAQDFMERVRLSWTTCDTSTPAPCGTTPVYSKYDNATLPAVPTNLPTGVTCSSAVSPATVSTATAPVRFREITLSCSGTGTGPAQSYSLVVTQP